MIVDPGLPAAGHLLGPGADHLVGAGLVELGGELVELVATQVVYRPGSELTVRYDAQVRWGDGPPRGEVLCTGTTRDGAPPGTVPLRAEGMEAGLWRYPFDPALPGLAAAVTAPGVAAVAGAFVGADPRLEVKAYRPGRRAVVRAEGNGTEVYLKVVRPGDLDRLVSIHRSLAEHLPVPEVMAGDPEAGILVLRALPGTLLRDQLRDDPGRLPSPEHLVETLDWLATVDPPAGSVPPTPVVEGPAHHIRMIERVLPRASDRLDRLRERLDELVAAETAVGPGAAPDRVLIHGDLHEAQLMVAGPLVTGMLDIDGVGPGERADDLGRLLGHLSALALGAGDHRGPIEAYVARLRQGFGEVVGPDRLALRAASVAVGLASGPFRVQSAGWEDETLRRIALAEWWTGCGPLPA